MKLSFTILVLIAFTSSVLAGVHVPLVSVKEDFHEASVVVRMTITHTEVTSTDSDHYYFTASGQVTTSFKGEFKPGQVLEFSVRAEHGYNHTSMRGDRIAFLTSFVNRRNGPFQELPDGNSVNPYSPNLLQQVRTIWREWHRRRESRH